MPPAARSASASNCPTPTTRFLPGSSARSASPGSAEAPARVLVRVIFDGYFLARSTARELDSALIIVELKSVKQERSKPRRTPAVI